MSIDVGYLLGCLCEYLIFVYFANTSLVPRRNGGQSNLLVLGGYALIWMMGLSNSKVLSILSFFVIHVVLIRCAYRMPFSNAVFYALTLDALSVISEYAVAYFFGYRFHSVREEFPMQQVLVIITGAKLLYLMGVQIFKRFIKGKIAYGTETSLILALIPLLSVVCLSLLITMEMEYSLFLLLCLAFLLMNVIVFYIHARLCEKNLRLKLLQKEYNANQTELSEYRLIAEKYENTKIMRHDLHKQLAVLREMIPLNNEEAAKYMQQMEFFKRELDYTQYTDNKILNILLAQKVQQCHKSGIELHIHSAFPALAFISEFDTVAIFSNLIDNAIEASANSEQKEIFVDLYTVNDTFSAVKVENNADVEPVILDGVLRTQKENKEEHGIGVKSINNALKKYNTSLNWSYDKENKFFRSLILIHVPQREILTT